MSSAKVEAYARALVEIAHAEGGLERVEDELFRVARAFESNDQLRATLSDTTIPSERRQQVVEQLLGGKASATTIQLVGLIVAAGQVYTGLTNANTALELTNTEKFCTSCHEMHDNVFVELKRTIHYSNRSGVRASCPDCHVPHQWTHKIARKMQASKEVWGHLFGTIDTREKFLDARLNLAKHEWARMKANDSLECRNCHSAESMDIVKQAPRAADAHTRFLFTGQKTCIDCHKGIAHSLPPIEQDIGAPKVTLAPAQ